MKWKQKNLDNFIEAIRKTREHKQGVSIKEIAEVIKDNFDDAEFSALIRELNDLKYETNL